MLLEPDKADQGFEEFWSVYPRRTAKAAAKKSWERAVVKIKADPQTIIAGARRYAEQRRGKDQEFIAHPSTWLNQQRWLDEDSPGEPPPIEPLGSRDREDVRRVGQIVAVSRIAYELRDKLIERTRHTNWSLIEKAGARCNVSGNEFWGCLLPEIEKRAWDFACAEAMGRDLCPQTVEITRENWLDGKMRVESRARHMRGMQQFGSTGGLGREIVRANRRNANGPSDNPGPEDEGMARATAEGPGGLGRGDADERGRGEDPGPVEGEDGEAAAGQPG